MNMRNAGSSLLQDLRYAVRGMGRNKAFFTTLVLSSALGIGAIVSVFTVLDPVLLRPLPYEDPEELLKVGVLNPESEIISSSFSWQTALEVREVATFLPTLFFAGTERYVRNDGELATTVWVTGLTPGAFSTLGVSPRIGRGFSEEDFLPGAPAVAVLSHEYWMSGASGRPDIVGTELRVDGASVTVVGVMPETFRFPYIGRPDFWVPMQNDGTMLGGPATGIELVARTPDGLTIEAVSERLTELSPGIPRINRTNPRVAVGRFFGEFRANDDVLAAFKVLALAGVVLLLMSVLNAANLLLARRSIRIGELALRRHLGASSARITRQLLTENLLVGLVAGGIAVGIVAASIPLLVGLLPSEVLAFSGHAVSVEWRTLLFTFGVAAFAGFTFGLLPAIGAGRTSRPGHTRGRNEHRIRNGLVVAEIALSLALLVGAGLLSSSFVRLVHVDPGFDPTGMAGISVGLPESLYPDGVSRREFAEALVRELRARPGIAAATFGQGLPPFAGFSLRNQVENDEGVAFPELEAEFISKVEAEPEVFEVAQIEILGGRAFLPGETSAEGIVIVDERFADRLWPDENPIGRRFRLNPDDEWLTVIGTVVDLTLNSLDGSRGRYDLLFPMPPVEETSSYLSFAVRSGAPEDQVKAHLAQALRAVDPGLPPSRIETVDEALWDFVEKPRFLLALVTLFTAIAVVLAAVGIFGVISVAVSQRKREIGIRVALGATTANVRTLVLKHGIGVAAAGIGLGLAGSVAGSSVIESLLFDIEPTDPFTLASMSVVMLGLTLLTSYLPARRAARIDPIEVLKAD